MSGSTQWAEHFGKAEWTGAAWGQGYYRDSDDTAKPFLGPADQLLHLFRNKLADDSVLSAMFGTDNIEVVEMRPPDIDQRVGRRLYLYTGTVRQEYQTTSADHKWITVYVGVAFLVQSVQTVKDGEATLASVLDYIEHVLKTNKELAVAVSASDNVSLVEQLAIEPYETINVVDKSGRLFAHVQEVQAIAQVVTDRTTNRIRPLVTAGVLV